MSDASVLLAAWEAGLLADPPRRAVLLHALACPELAVDELLNSPVGALDSAVHALRAALFGERLHARLTCSACSAELQFDFTAADLANENPATQTNGGEFTEGPWVVSYQALTAGDLLAAADAASAAQARERILTRCVTAVRRGNNAVTVAALPDSVLTKLVELLAAADPRADVQLVVPCVECGHQERAVLDIAAFTWVELDAWARRALLDVHVLASCYGWTESQVLAVPPQRRRYYLELCGHG